MAAETYYYLNGFQLTVHQESYLVYVHPWTGKAPRQDELSDLPDWILHSHSAIWLCDEDGSLYRRAIDGDRIKEQILTACALRKGA